MEVDHRLLHRMQVAVAPLQMLDRHDMAAVERAEEADAGVDAFIDQACRREPPDQHGAGAAIALGAAFLGAAQRRPQAADSRAASRPARHRQASTASPLSMKRISLRIVRPGPWLSSLDRSNSRRARRAAARDNATARPCRSGSAPRREMPARQLDPCAAQIVAGLKDQLIVAGLEFLARRAAAHRSARRRWSGPIFSMAALIALDAEERRSTGPPPACRTRCREHGSSGARRSHVDMSASLHTFPQTTNCAPIKGHA